MKLKTLFSFGAAMMTALLMSCSETIAEQGNGQKNTKLDEKTFVVSLNLDGGQGDDKNTGKAPQTRGIAVDRQQNNGTDSEILDFYFWDEWKSHTNLTHAGKYFRPSKVKITSPTLPK